MRLRTVAFSNLRRRTSRAAFLVAGLLVGIGTVVALLTLSQALTVQAQNNLETYGANIVVAPRTDGLSLSYGGVLVGRRAAAGARTSARRTSRASRPSPTAGTSPSSRPSCSARSRSRAGRRCSWACGPETSSSSRSGGAWTGGRRGRRRARRRLGGRPPPRPAHRRHRRRRRPRFHVTGVLRPTGSQDDDLLIADLGAAQSPARQAGQGLDGPGRRALQRLPGGGDRRPARRRAARHHGHGDAARSRNRMHAIDQFRTFSWIVAGVIIGIEALVVFVTMMGSVNERTREIGIFRALGFRRVHVTGLILIEAAVASLLAGVARLPRRHGRQLRAAAAPRRRRRDGGVGAGARRRGRRPRRRHRRRSARCTRRSAPAAWTRPSRCARCEAVTA